MRPLAGRIAKRVTIAHMEPIAYIRTDLPQKFGIPRNSFLAPHLQGRIIFKPEYALNSAVAGLEEFSHLWLLWQFENGKPGGGANDIASANTGFVTTPVSANDGASERSCAPNAPTASAARGTLPHVTSINGQHANAATRAEANQTHPAPSSHSQPLHTRRWSPTVRPPRLGGAARVGVFATRSPFRPNPIGLTCVKLDRVELTSAGPIIHVLGADLRDGTPIFDIKPYIPFADCHPDACGGWIENAPWHELDVDFPAQLQAEVPPDKLPGLIEVLRQDPRRAGSKHEPTRVYHLAYASQDIAFIVDNTTLHVVCVS